MQLIYSCLLLPALFSIIYADDVILQKRYFYPGEVAEPLEPKMKKPFCNAFTGCQRATLWTSDFHCSADGCIPTNFQLSCDFEENLNNNQTINNSPRCHISETRGGLWAMRRQTQGCGKKRSDESMSALVDMNSEPAVEDLSRQILSEAKLWEALQEARMELINRKHQTSVPWFLDEDQPIHSWRGAPIILDCYSESGLDPDLILNSICSSSGNLTAS